MINHTNPHFGNLWDSFREALIAAYMDHPGPTYTVPYHLDGDLFHFREVKNHREALKLIKAAVSNAIGDAVKGATFEDRCSADPMRANWEMALKPRHEDLPGWPSIPAAQRLMFELERHARLNCYSTPSNATIVEDTGLSLRMVQLGLRKLERLGWIKAVWAGPSGRHRRGFILLRRITLDTPAAETPEAIVEAERQILNHHPSATRKEA